MNIALPEFHEPRMQEAIKLYHQTNNQNVNFIPTGTLEDACQQVKNGSADTLIAGLTYSTRDILLACREHLGMAQPIFTEKPLFSGLAAMHREIPTNSTLNSTHKTAQTFLLADIAACKHPNAEQLAEIILQTANSAGKLLDDQPRIALLSFSTLGSGGQDETISVLLEAKKLVEKHLQPQNLLDDSSQSTQDSLTYPAFLLDGEFQLDAAVNPRVAKLKAPNSPVAGQANVLITPDLNCGNLIYKTFEQIAGYTVAGPLLQGFKRPIADLSRGSTPEDILFTIECMTKLAK